MAMRLYELTEAMEAIEERLLDLSMGTGEGEGQEQPESGADPREALTGLLEDLKEEFEGKVLSIGRMLKNWRSMVEALKQERAALARKEKALLLGIDRVREFLTTEMDRAKTRKVTDGVLSVSLRLCPPSVRLAEELEEVEDGILKLKRNGEWTEIPLRHLRLEVPKGLPTQYWEPYVRVAARRAKILQDWKNTAESPKGAEIQTTKRTVVVR